jgi:hypothetical protein
MYNNSHPGIEYGDGVLKGPGTPGQVVKSVGNNEFSVVSNAADVPAGILKRADKNCALQGARETTLCVPGLVATSQASRPITIKLPGPFS